MGKQLRDVLFLLAVLSWTGCTFDISGPHALVGEGDSAPLLFPDSGEGYRDGLSRDGLQFSDATVDGGPADTQPDVLGLDTRVDTTPMGCVNCGLLGCNETLKRCNRLAPSNIPLALVETLHGESLADCSITQSGEADGAKGIFGDCRPQGSEHSTREGVYWGSVMMPGNRLVTLFAMNSLTIDRDTVLRGMGSDPILIYAREGITIHGLIDVGAQLGVAGPGGGKGGEFDGASGEACEGGEGGGGDRTNEIFGDKSGGGGGGWGQRGAGGGWAASIPGGVGGELPLSSTTLSLVPLRGGCGGGAGGGSFKDGGPGGAGGGAIQLSAGTTLIVDGEGIYAAGGGGGGGHETDAGGGGGSGGSILLESVEVHVTAATPITANGGGGGAGGPEGLAGASGEDGIHDVSRADGGVAVYPTGSGGAGGAIWHLPGAGGYSSHAGGGGGGMGRCRIRARVSLVSSQLLSPRLTSDIKLSVW
ncbi:MAG: hypothetical protein JRH20_09980 [Deltaproteobacteria bacterium]|nr:hypothetical protein [Deltaproteobacteria bacterium]